MKITEQAVNYFNELKQQDPTKTLHLFAMETCCGNGVGIKLQAKKESLRYVEIDGCELSFEPTLFMRLPYVTIDIERIAQKQLFVIHE